MFNANDEIVHKQNQQHKFFTNSSPGHVTTCQHVQDKNAKQDLNIVRLPLINDIVSTPESSLSMESLNIGEDE